MATTGLDGVAAYFANLEATWEELRFCGARYRNLGSQVLALGRMEGRGSRGGVPVDAPMGIVIDFRGLEIIRLSGLRVTPFSRHRSFRAFRPGPCERKVVRIVA